MSKKSDKIDSFLKFLSSLFSPLVLRIISIIFLLIVVSSAIIGIVLHFTRGTEISILWGAYKTGVDYKNFGIIDATCDSRVKEAVDSFTANVEEQTPDVTQMPVITPEPIVEVTPDITEIVDPVIIPWDFNDGCIWSEWTYWVPDSTDQMVKEINLVDDSGAINCQGWDMSYFGLDALDEGLMFHLIQPDLSNVKWNVGLSRLFPDDKDRFQIRFNWDYLKAINEGDITKFQIGFVNSKEVITQGSFINFQRFYGNEGHYLYKDDGTDDNYIAWSTQQNQRKISIVCEITNKLYANCLFYMDDNPAVEKMIYFPKSWDSIYLGYELPHEGSINLTVTDVIISKDN